MNAILSAPPGMDGTSGIGVPMVGVTAGVKVGSGVKVRVGATVGGTEVATAVEVNVGVKRNGNCPRKLYAPPARAINKIRPAKIQPAHPAEERGAVCLSTIGVKRGIVCSPSNATLFNSCAKSSAVA